MCRFNFHNVNSINVTGFKCDEELDHTALGRAHLAEALALYEEALRLQRMCRSVIHVT